ncbi:ATP-grasp peptide maturase system methyltransferase [Streptomyces corynorhini]|uniref:Protein-L-isoaspartate O-methyltransferase n=1 Tax=Streptomyces corynorhini TaxID=2282652 RepID=A0A370B899_9ACTN|nr:ATP-grasp peptide maturase system methyltransferase [Streptomyces corynorhini]RDG36882.1 protein-L-isoaspartate(D-aspartate) O-methyltransferase [Streptomyces corynorhini]
MIDEARLLRERLTDTLIKEGSLRSAPWQAAVEATPRHHFLRGGFFRRVEGAVPSAWTPVRADDPDWLAACYTDTSLVTQIAGTIVPDDIRGEILRLPTSSSTLPSLVVGMLEDLLVEDGARVLEVGTGTGYSTALLAHRLGDELVTSIEYDDDVATRASIALGQTGHHPDLVVGDGLNGYPANAPYDRLIATCGVHTIPSAWIEQVRPGGLILTTVGGWLGSSEIARLTVAEDGTASGPLLGGQISFMFARAHLPPTLGMLPDFSEGGGSERPTRVGGDVLRDWTARFVAQLAAPRAQHVTMVGDDGRTEQVVLDVASGAWALLYEKDGAWTVRQGGPTALWDAVEAHLDGWESAGSPPLKDFTVTVTGQGQTIHW